MNVLATAWKPLRELLQELQPTFPRSKCTTLYFAWQLYNTPHFFYPDVRYILAVNSAKNKANHWK